MRKIFFIISIGFLLLLFFLLLMRQQEMSNDFDLQVIEINKVKLFMTRKEVEALYGAGTDNTPGCFGCEMNFIYPQLKLSGRYSETLDRMKRSGQIDHTISPKVKQLTTTDESISIFGVRVGDQFKNARVLLESIGFHLQSVEDDYFYNYYTKSNIYIRLWTDNELNHLNKERRYQGKDDEVIRSITIEVRVTKDEKILY